MFDKSTYTKELINTCKNYKSLQERFFQLGAEGNEIEQKKLVPRLNKAYEEYAKEHNKWCEKYGYPRLKI